MGRSKSSQEHILLVYLGIAAVFAGALVLSCNGTSSMSFGIVEKIGLAIAALTSLALAINIARKQNS